MAARSPARCDDRPGGQPEADAELGRHDLRQRRLAQPRRAGEQDMVERVAARAGGLDEHGEVGAQLGLADELGEPARAQADVAVLGRRRPGSRSARSRGQLLQALTDQHVDGEHPQPSRAWTRASAA